MTNIAAENDQHTVVLLAGRKIVSLGRIITLFFVLCWSLASHAQTPGAYLGDLSWPEAERRFSITPVVIVPFGAGAKEHGPHLPMNADRVVMDYLLQAAVESSDVIVAPPILHGWFPAFRDFPGTEVADPTVFQNYIQQVGMSLAQQGAQRIVFLNTGISKATGLPISIAAREIRVQAGVPTLVVSWDDLETDEIAALQEQDVGGHGDEIETSINLYLQSELVDMELAVRDYGERADKDYGGYQPGRLTRDRTDPAYTASGIFGDATLATPEKGRLALQVLTREWIRALEGFAQVPLKRSE
jgi:creatinine amidohydrolase